MRGQAHARNLTLERSGTAEHAVIHGAEAAISRLCTALVANALDHATTTVTVRIDVEGRTAVVSVVDDGPGFPPDLVPHAFEPFVTGRPGDGGHSGLGLAIVAEITRRHRGRVRILEGDHGTVELRLPLGGPAPPWAWPPALPYESCTKQAAGGGTSPHPRTSSSRR